MVEPSFRVEFSTTWFVQHSVSSRHFDENRFSLAESNDSFAYSSSGKKLGQVNDQPSEETYGEPFGPTDVLTCYVDFGNNDENDESHRIRFSFAKNGQDLGEAFELDPKSLGESSPENRFIFYPHILVKNVQFECNFGQLVSYLNLSSSSKQFNAL